MGLVLNMPPLYLRIYCDSIWNTINTIINIIKRNRVLGILGILETVVISILRLTVCSKEVWEDLITLHTSFEYTSFLSFVASPPTVFSSECLRRNQSPTAIRFMPLPPFAFIQEFNHGPKQGVPNCSTNIELILSFFVRALTTLSYKRVYLCFVP
jgi:hypothetical protein